MISNEEFHKLTQELDIHHGIFSKIWQMGKPVSDPSIPTAAIRFDHEGGFFEFCFNPDFWKSLDSNNRKFVICHEALHVILNHGLRSIGKDLAIANKAEDVVINETLVTNFGFDRFSIKDQQIYCWYDTVFPDKQDLVFEKSFEYYYDLLIKDQSGGKGNKNSQSTVDVHAGFGSENQDDIDQKLNEAVEGLSPEEAQDLANKIDKILDDTTRAGMQAGTGAGGLIKVIKLQKIIKKKKWETVIKRWVDKHLKQVDCNKEQWARVNRRFVTMTSSNEFFIPTEMEVEEVEEKKHKIKVFFFLDTSGSCAHLADRFFKAASSLPEDRFELHLCCFDTQVYETSLKSGKLYGFGGTSFHIIETYIRNKTKNEKYPAAVFIITDGYGDSVSPKHPERWYWFLSADYTSYIPKTSHKFNLKDYE